MIQQTANVVIPNSAPAVSGWLATDFYYESIQENDMKHIIFSLIAALAFSAGSVAAKNGPKDIDSIVDVAVAANAPD